MAGVRLKFPASSPECSQFRIRSAVAPKVCADPDRREGITASIFGELWSAHIANSFVGGFFGFVSTEAFTQVHLSEGVQCAWYETYTVDNVVYASSSDVPEPGTLVLLGAGLLGLAGATRRFR